MNMLNETPFPVAMWPWLFEPKRWRMTFLVKGTFELAPGKVIAVAEEDQPSPTGDEPYDDIDEDPPQSVRYASDFALFKPRADLLLVGKAHAPGGNPVPYHRVTFGVGARSKALAIFGDRHWKTGLLGSGSSDPERFADMPLRYENSLGGPGSDLNPIGKGIAKVETESGQKLQLLPNIEDPRALVSSPGDRPAPAGYGPLYMRWAQRWAKIGTYRGKWTEERWPCFAEDLDWGFFNAAPPDMQVEGYLKGDEELYLEHLHPGQPEFRTKLPGLRVRCFLDLAEPLPNGADLFHELNMNLDTLWVDTEALNLVLVWRGVVDVHSEELKEFRNFLVVSERLDDPPQAAARYQERLPQLLVEEEEEERVVPEAPPGDEPPDVDVEAEIAKAEAQVREALVAAGHDPDAAIAEAKRDSDERTARVLADLGVDPGDGRLTREQALERVRTEEGLAGLDLRGLDLSEQDFKKALFAGARLQGANFTNSDLAGADLAGADLSGANLAGANLTKANLRECDFTGAALTSADLREACLDQAVFEGASLGKAVLDGCTAQGADFSGVNLVQASLKGCALQEAALSESTLDGASFAGANLTEASVTGAKGDAVDMSDAVLTDLRASDGCALPGGVFVRVQAKGSIWEDARLTGADFSGADLEGVEFSGANLEGAILNAANMKFGTLAKCNLKDAQMKMANLFQGSLEKADLSGADLRGANLFEAELMDAVFEGANLEFSNLKMTKLAKRQDWEHA
ncbi:MAG: DUF2169 domain-containing protein [Kiritimatiellae bacterium]|nr:DUF2169 domain-containing protein [Kiritimatiellia bacterium]